MNFHIPTAMQLTATMTLVIGLALAFAMTGYPRALQDPIRLWVRGLLLLPFSFVLFALRGQIPDWLSIVLANTILVVAFALFMQALRAFNRHNDTSIALVVLVGLTIVGEILLTYVWPTLSGRIGLLSVVITTMLAIGVNAIYRKPEPITRPEHMVATMLLIGAAILIVRAVVTPDTHLAVLTMSTPMQGVVFTYASLMPVIATSGFLLMCGERLNKDLARLATLDPLTGIFNRRTMAELAHKAVAASRRHGRALSLLVLDIDHFKRINDQFGHEAGDLALRRVVELVKGELRESDLFARIGGEEFAVVLPEADEKAATAMAERVRLRLFNAGFAISGWPVELQVSIGVGTLGPKVSDLETLFRQTDRAMYAAKRAGRNRVVSVSQMAELALEPTAADHPEAP
jgi:diguanylate cyclase (GGDEF)-like protein